MKLDAFTQAYIECALWTSEEDIADGSLLSEAAIKSMAHDCAVFRMNCSEELSEAGDDSQNGHDFWLTRNGHGTGFWDRDYPKNIATALTNAAKKFGESSLYVGDDGEIEVGQ